MAFGCCPLALYAPSLQTNVKLSPSNFFLDKHELFFYKRRFFLRKKTLTLAYFTKNIKK